MQTVPRYGPPVLVRCTTPPRFISFVSLVWNDEGIARQIAKYPLNINQLYVAGTAANGSPCRMTLVVAAVYTSAMLTLQALAARTDLCIRTQLATFSLTRLLGLVGATRTAWMLNLFPCIDIEDWAEPGATHTPLAAALSAGDTEAVSILLSHGADPWFPLAQGLTPYLAAPSAVAAQCMLSAASTTAVAAVASEAARFSRAAISAFQCRALRTRIKTATDSTRPSELFHLDRDAHMRELENWGAQFFSGVLGPTSAICCDRADGRGRYLDLVCGFLSTNV